MRHKQTEGAKIRESILRELEGDKRNFFIITEKQNMENQTICELYTELKNNTKHSITLTT